MRQKLLNTLMISDFHAVCKLPADPGPCQAAIPRYFYSSSKGACEKLTYGGCDGNKNNFETLEGCDQQCNPNGLSRYVNAYLLRML